MKKHWKQVIYRYSMVLMQSTWKRKTMENENMSFFHGINIK